MINKNDERIGIISDFGSEGEGIIKDEDKVIFVPFALQRETVKYKVLKVSKNIAYGKVLNVIEPSNDRIQPVCSVFTKCGGCQLQHVNYDAQLEIKRKIVENAFVRVANIKTKVDNVICGDSSFRYRNKLQLPISQVGDKTLIGFYAENSHRVIDIEDCPINAEWTKPLINALREYLSNFSIKGYNEFDKSGDVRELTAREVNGNLIITLVSLKDNVKGILSFVEIIKRYINNDFSLFLNINNLHTNKIYGDTFKLIYGPSEYQGEMLGVKFKMGVQSFMQVNESVCKKLYSTVNTLLDAKTNSVVIDAYSGAGLMTALLAKGCSRAIGIEVVKEATILADELMLDNGLSEKVSNYNAKCEDILPDIIAKERSKNAEICLVLDPPRKGCDLSIIELIKNSDIDKIVYVSCKPSTLARDIGLLVGTLKNDNGKITKSENLIGKYSIDKVIPFDMFPQTKHVETIVYLTKNR